MNVHTILTIICLFAISPFVQSQNFVLNNNNFNLDVAMLSYKPINNTADRYEKVSEGSPWLRKYWCTSYLTDGKGNTYLPSLIKIDLVADRLLYLDKGVEMELVTPIMYLTAIDSLTNDTLKMVRADYYKLNNENIKGWLQVEAIGKAILLQDLNKSLFENKAYNSAVTDLQVLDKNSWIIFLEGTAHVVKKIKEGENLLVAGKPSLQNFRYTQKGLGPQLRELVMAFNR